MVHTAEISAQVIFWSGSLYRKAGRWSTRVYSGTSLSALTNVRDLFEAAGALFLVPPPSSWTMSKGAGSASAVTASSPRARDSVAAAASASASSNSCGSTGAVSPEIRSSCSCDSPRSSSTLLLPPAGDCGTVCPSGCACHL